MRKPIPVSQKIPDNEVHRLLEFYDRAMLQATLLPLIEWLPCRPSRWRLLRPFSRLPRLTLGTRTLIIRHIDQSLSALGHRYTAREALDTSSPRPTEDRDTCVRYRESLPIGRHRWMVVGFAVPALFLTAVLIEAASRWTSEGRKIKELLAAMLAYFAVGSRSADAEKIITKAFELGITGLLASLAILLIGCYVLTRPFVPAFRLKRQILNLSDQDDHDIRESASSWHVTKSVGAYQQERKVFTDLGYRPPREFPLDLVVLIFPIACLTVAAIALAWSAAVPVTIRWWALWLAGLAGLRAVWLWSVWRGRQDQDRTPPAAGVAKGTGRYVESRPITEAVALPFLIFTALWLYPLLGAVTFYRFALTADRLRAAAAIRDERLPRGGRPLLAVGAFAIATLIYIPIRFVWKRMPELLQVTAWALVVAAPIVVLVLHLWRLTELFDVDRPARRRYRRCAAVACSLLLVLLVSWFLQRIMTPEQELQKLVLVGTISSGILALYALLMGAIQRCQNRLVTEERLTIPVPNGICEGSTTLDQISTSSHEALGRLVPPRHPASRRHMSGRLSWPVQVFIEYRHGDVDRQRRRHHASNVMDKSGDSHPS
ncbi:hypothetical protein [Streptosporangium sp. NPDC049046]|uniref:hypothetical protein n=1 Tax=unclassified Streptosporangium TaxID=2632669 RepID=UPI003436A52B